MSNQSQREPGGPIAAKLDVALRRQIRTSGSVIETGSADDGELALANERGVANAGTHKRSVGEDECVEFQTSRLMMGHFAWSIEEVAKKSPALRPPEGLS